MPPRRKAYLSKPFKFPSRDKKAEKDDEEKKVKSYLEFKKKDPYDYFLPPITLKNLSKEPTPATPRRQNFQPEFYVMPCLSTISFELCREANEDGFLNWEAWVRAMMALEINRPSQMERFFNMFGGESQGMVSVQFILREIETILTSPETCEETLKECFRMFTTTHYLKILKSDLDELRVARTERGGHTRAMICELIQAIKEADRTPTDKRKYLSFQEFKELMTGTKKRSASLLKAFLPKIFSILDPQQDIM